MVNYVLNQTVASLKASATLRINELSQKIEDSGRTVFRLGLGQSPFPVPKHIVKSLADHAHEKAYMPVAGFYPLKEVICQYWKRTQSLNFQPDNVIIGPGSKELLFLLQLVLRGRLIIPQPSWVSYAPQTLIATNELRWIPSIENEGWRLDLDALEEILKENTNIPSMLLINYPSNPTGREMSDSTAKALAKIARKHGLLVISDEIYGDVEFDGGHQSIAKWYPEGTIVSSGLAKWCGAGGWRLGQMAFPQELSEIVEKMAVVASESFTSVNSPVQYAAITAYTESEATERYLHQSRRILRHCASIFYSGLTDMGVEVQMAQGGFYLFPNFSPLRVRLAQMGIDDSVSMCDRLLNDTGVAMLPGVNFGMDSKELCCRLAYVDFDGEKALHIATAEYADKDLDDDFSRQAVPKLVEAMELIHDWIQN